MIEEINRLLADMQSLFRTEDGLRLVRHCGGLRFLVKQFSTPEECLAYVKKAGKVTA